MVLKRMIDMRLVLAVVVALVCVVADGREVVRVTSRSVASASCKCGPGCDCGPNCRCATSRKAKSVVNSRQTVGASTSRTVSRSR